MGFLRNLGTVVLLGKEYPVKFGTNQAAIYCDLQKCNLAGYHKMLASIGAQEVQGSEFRDFIYSALKDGARASKKDFDLTPEDVADLMDAVGQDEPQKFTEILQVLIPKTPEQAVPNETPAAKEGEAMKAA
ncbi:hypothetical protein [Nibribacter koreensis]|uniref:Uncharacterized protein n=1 Tax=Nibribacter koreensis TaxID=1084519 RepID=A0ABP8FAY4_9BACT